MLDGFWRELFEVVHLEYSLITLLLTYLIITQVKFIKAVTSKQKSLVAFSVAIVLGVLFWLYDREAYTVPNLISSAAVSVTLYQWFVKHVISTFLQKK